MDDDKLIERHDRWLSIWKSQTDLPREQARLAAEAAIRFAELAIKNCGYLNAGGLLAVPVMLGQLGMTLKGSSGYSALVIGGLYSVGLCLSVIAAVCAYFACSKQADANHRFVAAETARMAELPGALRGEVPLGASAAAMPRADGEQLLGSARGWQRWAVTLTFGSLLIFVVTSLISAQWIWDRL